MTRTFIPLIYSCNDNCISCPVPRASYKSKPSFKEVIKEIDAISKKSKRIEFNGGEPTLRKDILKILGYIEKKNFNEITILTNAQAFHYKKYARVVAKIKNLKIITTIYGHNSRIHDAISRTPHSFEYKIAGIKNLIKNNVPVELRILLHKMNYKYFSGIVNFLINNFDKSNFNKIVIMSPKLTGRAKKHKRSVAEKITVLSRVLGKPIRKLIENGYNVKIYHFPHCTLQKALWKYSSGLTSNNREVVYSKGCKGCIKKQECSRIWRSYLDVFGSDEFKPIKK